MNNGLILKLAYELKLFEMVTLHITITNLFYGVVNSFVPKSKTYIILLIKTYQYFAFLNTYYIFTNINLFLTHWL